MQEATDTKPQPESSPLNRNLLEEIWKVFILYDRSAIKAQKRFILLRKLTLILTVIATTLAVIESVIVKKYFDPNSSPAIFFHSLVIIVPIIVSVLLAGSIKFGRGVNWIFIKSKCRNH